MNRIIISTLFVVLSILSAKGIESEVAYGWLKQGKVVRHTSNVGYYREGIIYLFLVNRENPVVLSGSIWGTERLVVRQSFTEEEMQAFISKSLPELLVSTQCNGVPVTRGLVAEYQDYVDSPNVVKQLRTPIDASVVARLKELQAAFRTSSGKTDWELQYYVITREGSVEKWRVKGKTNPFSILLLERDVAPGNETIPLIPRIM